MLVSSSTRLPLSLGPCENNEIIPLSSSSSSSSGSIAYRYPEANRCHQIVFDAQQCFIRMRREEPIVSKKITSWMVCSLITALSVGVASALSRTSAYRHLLIPIAVIGGIFFFVVCLPKLFGARKELNDLKEAESQVYRQAEALINDIFTRLNAVNTIFPDDAIQNGQLTENFEINQELENNLEQWVDTLRLVHGLDVFNAWVEAQPLQDRTEGNLCYIDDCVDVMKLYLPDIIQSIEDCRTAVAVITDRESIWPGDSYNVQTRRVQGELSHLVSLIGLQNDARAALSTVAASANNA